MERIGDKGYHYTIDLPPVTKKNHQQIAKNRRTGAMFITPSKQYKEYEYNCGWFLKSLDEPIDYPVHVKCLFYMPDARNVDLNNLLEAATDVLTHYGILKDDNAKIVCSHDGSRVFFSSKTPKTEIFIEPFEEEIVS